MIRGQIFKLHQYQFSFASGAWIAKIQSEHKSDLGFRELKSCERAEILTIHGWVDLYFIRIVGAFLIFSDYTPD